MIAVFAIFFSRMFRGRGNGEAAGLGSRGDVNVEPLAGEMGEG